MLLRIQSAVEMLQWSVYKCWLYLLKNTTFLRWPSCLAFLPIFAHSYRVFHNHYHFHRYGTATNLTEVNKTCKDIQSYTLNIFFCDHKKLVLPHVWQFLLVKLLLQQEEFLTMHCWHLFKRHELYVISHIVHTTTKQKHVTVLQNLLWLFAHIFKELWIWKPPY